MRQLFMRLPTLANLPETMALPEGYALRQYQEGDEEALAETLQSAFPEIKWGVEDVKKQLLDPEDVKATFVIDFGGKPVATASARLVPDKYPESGYLHWVGAHADHTGKKLGLIVTYAVMDYFAQAGCKDAVLETDDFRKSAISLYLRMGFAPETTDETHPQRWAKIYEEMGLSA